jgi:hypothetical protein
MGDNRIICGDCHKPVDIKDAYFVKIRDSMRCIPVAICPDCVPKHKGKKSGCFAGSGFNFRRPKGVTEVDMEE